MSFLQGPPDSTWTGLDDPTRCTNCVLGKKSLPTMMEGELNPESSGNYHPVVPTLGFRLVCSDSLSGRAMETRFKLGKKGGQHWESECPGLESPSTVRGGKIITGVA